MIAGHSASEKKTMRNRVETFGVPMCDTTVLLFVLFGLFMFTAAFTAVRAERGTGRQIIRSTNRYPNNRTPITKKNLPTHGFFSRSATRK